MPLQIIRNDITKMQVDAIVNPTNHSLTGSGGVDAAIHRAAGEGLARECRQLGGCKPGKAILTSGYALPCKYVIHTVGPVYRDGKQGEKALLESCYTESLLLAKAQLCESIAFPLISSGAFGYPKEQALKTAISIIGDFLLENDMMVYLVIFDRETYRISEKLFCDIAEYIDDHYVDVHVDCRNERTLLCTQRMAMPLAQTASTAYSDTEQIGTMLLQLDESFSQMLLRKIDEKGMKDSECYKKANIDRKLFSKIRSDMHYKPSKPTAIAFAVALELTLPETEELLRKAGFALSRSNKFDIIIEYFIRRGNYNIFEINEALFAFDQSLLGA